jgi:Fur family transcriptional regulator, ferric uptake regulator
VADQKAVEEEIQLFHSYLRQHGLKKTHQKELILKTFLRAEGHLSVEDVYELVKKKDKRVGIVTVFRTLKSLSDCGIARIINLHDDVTRFEHDYQHPHHHHIVCTECHKAIEFISPELERIQDSIVGKYNFKPKLHRLEIYGVCQDCQEKPSVADPHKNDTEKVFARDALKMAIEMEKRGIQFYRDLAARNQDPRGVEVLQEVVSEELRHLEGLEADLRNIQEQESGLENAPIFLHFDRNDLEKLAPDTSAHEKHGQLFLDARAALALATEYEKRAAGFIRDFADKFIDTEGKRIFLQFAEAEQHHFDLIHQRVHEVAPSI